HAHLDPYVNHVDLGEQNANSLWDRKDSLFIYPPSARVFLSPLSHLRYDPARIAFGSLMALLMVAILRGLHRRIPEQTFVLFALFLTLPMIKNVDNGNIDVLILALILAAFYIGDGALAGLCLGVAISIKLAPVLLVAWFIARRRYKTALYAILSSTTLFLAALSRYGTTYWREFFNHLAHHESPNLPTLGHVFTSIYKVKDRVLVTSDGVYAYQHDINGYLQNPLHILGRIGAPLGILIVLATMAWLFFTRRGRWLTSEQSFFILLPISLLANNLLWPMGLVACFPLIVLLVDDSPTPNLTALLLIVPFVLTKQLVGNWNFGLWLIAAGYCVYQSGWLNAPDPAKTHAWPLSKNLFAGI
ncbi:MAG: glycosyltransferase family 87 protein, partial [Acidobacteriota bacterium]